MLTIGRFNNRFVSGRGVHDVEAAAIPLVLVLVLGAVAYLQDWGGVRAILTGEEAAVAPKSINPSTGTGDASKESLAAGAEEGGVVFVSRWANTTKIRVRCKEDAGSGKTEARIDRDAARRCSVTAMREDRTRITAVLDVASEGTWVCFEDGAKECRDQ